MKLPKKILEKAKEILSSPNFQKQMQKELGGEKLVSNSSNKYIYELFIDDEIPFEKDLVKEFVDFCLKLLKIKDSTGLKVVLSIEKDKFTTYAYYDLNIKLVAVYCIDRAILDCFRSLAHELVHFKQDINNEIKNDQVSDENDGVPIEDEANSIAGVIMRKFGRIHKELY